MAHDSPGTILYHPAVLWATYFVLVATSSECYEGQACTVYLQVKLRDPCLSALRLFEV